MRVQVEKVVKRKSLVFTEQETALWSYFLVDIMDRVAAHARHPLVRSLRTGEAHAEYLCKKAGLPDVVTFFVKTWIWALSYEDIQIGDLEDRVHCISPTSHRFCLREVLFGPVPDEEYESRLAEHFRKFADLGAPKRKTA